ncbi:MAG: endonuclease/exonuclease/phosphatase family protein [Dehalococcoidia bacterium]|nr:endonuclease/exonuclease/phosphatase family protein [Dehalococcoidia bacterium]
MPRVAVALVGWVASLPLACAALLRVVAHDRWVVSIWADAFTFWIYLPAYAVALAGVYFRQWRLLAIAAGVAALHLTWVLPDYRAAATIPAEAWTAPRLRFFSANLKFDNEDFGPLMAEAAAFNPDVLLLQEFTPRAEVALRDAGLDRMLPYHVSDPVAGSRGTAIYSRFPVDGETWTVAGIQMTRATIAREGLPLRVYNVHPVSPTSRANAALWADEMTALVEALGGEQGRLVVAGDFNTTQHHVWYSRLLALGLRDAHVDRGRGNATSWPYQTRLLPEIRIDQVLVGGRVTPLSIREGRGAGSDHRPMLFELALLP